ncbi:MAG TPA: hypothetical protein VGJ15_06340 [Pirellulales bacterium]
MSIDPYSPCPGGTGKKVKFCCADLLPELDKVHRMLDGEQLAAALDYVRKLDEKYPNRACLQSIRISLEDTVGDPAAANTTLAALLKQQPENPIGLAEQALHTATAGDPLAAILHLQHAIEACGEEMPARVYDAVGAVALVLLSAGHPVPARAHLQLQVGLSQGRDQRAVTSLLQVEGSATIPLPLKDMPPLAEPPENVPWRAAFIKAMEESQVGHWKKAVDGWKAIATQAASGAAIWQNLATVCSYLGDYPQAIDALRRLAALSPADDSAMEAEALAQLLAKDQSQGQVDELTLSYTISNAEALQEKIAADRRFERLPLDPRAWAAQNEPPPRAAYSLLDRAVPTSGKEITREQVPNQVAQFLLFGKQTDREARLETVLFRPEIATVQKILSEVGGDLVGAAPTETVIGQLGQVEHALSWHWRLPDDTPETLRRQLAVDERRHLVLEKWPKLSQPIFGGRSAQQAASEPRYRHALLAAIWLLEVSDADTGRETYNELRRSLNLPELPDLDPSGLDTSRVPLGRVARLKSDLLSDEQLQHAFNRAAVTNFLLALRRLAPEVVKRPSMPVTEYKLTAYRLLVRSAASFDEALRLIDEARKLGDEHKQSSAPWDLMELAYRIQRGEAPQVMQLIDHLQRQHGREPGVAQALVQLLMETGLLGPDGRLNIGPAAGAPAAAAASPLVVPGAATGEPGKLWTPDDPRGGGEKKSSLWLPE